MAGTSPLDSSPHSKSALDSGISLEASDTVIGLAADSGDTSVQLGGARMPQVPLSERSFRTASSATTPRTERPRVKNTVPDRSSPDIRFLASEKLVRYFEKLNHEYLRAEKRLVSLESQLADKRPTGFWSRALHNAINLTSHYEIYRARKYLQEIATRREDIVKNVHNKAQLLQHGLFIKNGDAPTILRHASVPVNKQNRLPDLQQLIERVSAEVEHRSSSAHSPRESHLDTSITLSRDGASGDTESIMFRYNSDGRVSYFTRTNNSAQWVRVATIWNDDAYKIAQSFIENKKLPTIRKTPPSQKRAIEAPRFDDEWSQKLPYI